MPDKLMNRLQLAKHSNKDVLAILQKLYPERELYSLSHQDWRTTAKYILKARGTKGDVIVGWR